MPASLQPALQPSLTGRRGPPEPPPPSGLGPSRRPPPHVPRVAIAFAATLASPPLSPSPPPSPVYSRGQSRSRRRPDPRGGACALRAAMGAGASRRGLGAGGARHVALGWEGASRSARAAAPASNFTRSGPRALRGDPGRCGGAACVGVTRVESGSGVGADLSGTVNSSSLIPGTRVPRRQGLTWSRRLTAP